MKVRDQRIITGSGLLAAALMVSMFTASCEAPKGESAKGGGDGNGLPKIMIVGGDSVNWGEVPPGVLKKEVQIVNVGEDTLKIANVHPSCGCTTAPLDRKELAPGDTGRVLVSMDVANRNGEQHKSLTITSNDSTRPQVIVQLKAMVVRDLVVNPEFFPMIDSARTGAEDTTSIQIENTGKTAVTVEPPSMPSAPEMLVKFDMTSPRVLQPGEKLRVVATVKPIKEGSASAEVHFKTSSTTSPELKATLTCNVMPKG